MFHPSPFLHIYTVTGPRYYFQDFKAETVRQLLDESSKARVMNMLLSA